MVIWSGLKVKIFYPALPEGDVTSASDKAEISVYFKYLSVE